MSGELVTVATFNDPVEAAIARNYLEAAGISALLLDEMTVATNWGMANAVGGIKLQVGRDHVEDAEALLCQIPDDDADEVPSIALAMAPTADEPFEPIDYGNRKDQAVDRLFRATVFGLLFWPLQFYALWMLLTVCAMDGSISADRRWKLGASLLLSVPLMGLAVATLMCMAGLF